VSASSFLVRPSQPKAGWRIGTHLVIKDGRDRFGGLTIDDLKLLRDSVDAYLDAVCSECGGSGVSK